MIRAPLAALHLALVLAGPAAAQGAIPESLPVDGAIAPDGRAVTLSWFETDRARVASVAVSRRRWGETGAETWRPLAELARTMRFVDDTVRAGAAYEYRVSRADREPVDAGYWLAGVELPAVEARGHAHVVVDETLAAPLAAHLDRFERDLLGDGWRVTRLEAPRADAAGGPAGDLWGAAELKARLSRLHEADPFAEHAVILVGHLPVVRSGRAAPDGHDPKAQPTDLFYGDVDGVWTVDATGALLDSRVPGDFIEMQVGRIDFQPVSGDDPARELHLLRAYLDKNHHWRNGLLGDLRAAYADNGHLRVERHGLRNVVGPEAIAEGGHHDAGERGPWLWGVDFGDHDGGRYAERYGIEAVFAINFGSAKQYFDARGNAMTALLAQPWYPIAVGWGARPAWRLHPMALGGSIGEVHRRTVNNGRAARPPLETMDYLPTGAYLWRNPVWVNLLGDPTARPFVLAPPAGLRAVAEGAGVALSWTASPDPDATGYRIWRAEGEGGRFRPLNGGEPVAGTAFRDPSPVPGSRYMVRATGLKRVHAGSFHTLSQGVFAAPEASPLEAGTLSLSVAAGEMLRLPRRFDAPEGGTIHAIVEGPEEGRLVHEDGGWRYTPPAGFRGEVTLRFTRSDRWRTAEGRLRITVGP